MQGGPTSGNGKLLWHTLGAKTIELIHQNVHVEAIRDDLDTLVVDAALLEVDSARQTRNRRQGRSISSSGRAGLPCFLGHEGYLAAFAVGKTRASARASSAQAKQARMSSTVRPG